MEVDFDKEIDAMLRKAQPDAPVLIGDFTSSRHLDTDEISAFAENAMPEKSRSLHMAHLADCDRCRKILSNLLVMNSESAPMETSAGVITIAERAPWYRRLFLFPNLAYVMGGLVLLFSGFLGYTVIQKSTGSDAIISQATAPAESSHEPNFQYEAPGTTGDQLTANTASNSAANVSGARSGLDSNSSASGLAGELKERGPASGSRAGENNFVLDGVDAGSADVTAPAAAAAAPPASTATQSTLAAPKDARERDEPIKEKEENKITGLASEQAKTDSSISKQQQYNLPTQSGPMRNNESQYNRQMENLERSRSMKSMKRSAPRNDDEDKSSGGNRSVGGKTFERKQGVWYDAAYQGRPTINVRRGSAEFNKLDAGLKSIANSLSGTAVIVWGAKAYRIQ